MRVEAGLPYSIPDTFVHHLDCPSLPVEDLLDRGTRRVTLREHGNDYVGCKPLIHRYFVHNLLGYFTWNGVVAVGITVGEPGVGRSKKVLVLNIDEVFCISDALKTETSTPLERNFFDKMSLRLLLGCRPELSKHRQFSLSCYLIVRLFED